MALENGALSVTTAEETPSCIQLRRSLYLYRCSTTSPIEKHLVITEKCLTFSSLKPLPAGAIRQYNNTPLSSNM